MTLPRLKTTPTTELILAFDIGSTFTSVSYGIRKLGRKDIVEDIRFSEGELDSGVTRTPSILNHDKSGIPDPKATSEPKDGSKKFEWTKLYPRPKKSDTSITSDSDKVSPRSVKKSDIDTLSNFLKYLFDCTKTYIVKHHDSIFTWSAIEDSIQFIFTHPNGWEVEQQQLYHQAIERAGLIPYTRDRRSRVYMLTDGEANLYYYVKDFPQREPQSVSIIDAGSGTIDLSLYAITPVSCEEIASAECYLQGSIDVTPTPQTKASLKEKIKDWGNSSDGEISKFAHEFNESTKLAIKGDQESIYLRVARDRYDNTKYNVEDGMLKLSSEEATGLFNDFCNAITSSIKQQEIFAKKNISAVFIVGGLSNSEWLWSRLDSYFKAKKIDIHRPGSNFNSTVSRGAVLCLLGRKEPLVSSRVARTTYGIHCSLPAKENDTEHVQRKEQWEGDPTGVQYVPGFFQPIVHKGDRVYEGTECQESFTLLERNRSDFRMKNIRLMCYRGTLSNPKWVNEDELSFSSLCIIRAELSEAIKGRDLQKVSDKGEDYYKLDYDVIIFYKFAELHAELRLMNRRVLATISFDDFARAPSGAG